MRLYFTLYLTVFWLMLNAQAPATQPDDLQQEINQQVWLPFIASYNSFDTEAFMSIHTPDVLRIIRDNNAVIKAAEYRQNVSMGNKSDKENNNYRNIRFSFLERMAIEDAAFEVGYYKVEFKGGDGREWTSYGKFHVVLKKVDGQWKIAVDSDTSLGNTITEEDFQKGTQLE